MDIPDIKIFFWKRFGLTHLLSVVPTNVFIVIASGNQASIETRSVHPLSIRTVEDLVLYSCSLCTSVKILCHG
jgi:hypothetical protein